LHSDKPTQLVNIQELIPDIIVDIRYATPDNFTGRVIYPAAKAYLVKPAAEALAAVRNELRDMQFGLKIYDAYRPLSAQLRLWDIVSDPDYVADPAKGSRHNRGAAVDVTLVDRKGNELPMPTPYDTFSEKAHADYPHLPKQILKNRELLKNNMMKHGFEPLLTEWWHFDYQSWEKYPILDIDFDQLTDEDPD